MKTSTIIAIVGVVAVIAVGAFYFVDIDQTRTAKLPDVDVSVELGQLPKYDVETGSIEVGTEEKTILVPEVGLVEKKVTVPTVDVEPAGE